MATARSDVGLGYGLLFAFLAGVGALGMFVGAPGDLSGWAFVAALLFGALAIVAVQAYGA
ncbi:hypothetical protein BRD17_05600 [Halobacteriales archaeon SW_7_68_16]|nr:MAG: hypothetical protein BRD17_05600 [Halobacteriales archaeon SW_7_68_16]